MSRVTDLSEHIAELLYLHDCVIVPGLGAFILHEETGRYQSGLGQFLPPSREVTFNSLLRQDDGVLANHLNRYYQTDYQEAKKITADYVNFLFKELHAGKSFKFPGIGSFILSSENKLLFSPIPGTNFCAGSFGLFPVMAQPQPGVTKRVSQQRLSKPRADRKPHSGRSVTPASVKWTVAASLPLILFLLWGIIFPASFQNTYTSYSSLFSGLFDISQPALANPESGKEAPSSENLPPIMTEATGEISSDAVMNVQSHYPDIPAVKDPESNSAPPHTTLTAMKYHVIGGVFRSMTNAERYLECLKSIGYDASLVGTNPEGHHRVSYGSFDSWSKAEEFLSYIQANENPAAWILNY